MDTDFYDVVLPSSGMFCAVSIDANDRVRQTFHSTKEELLQRGEEIAHKENSNAYFALASYRDNSSRAAANAVFVKSLFLDLDCGDAAKVERNTGFTDKPAAMQALRDFVDRHSMPSPYVVDSGRGVHVYWPFTQEVPVEQWLPMARAFKTLCLASRFPIDPAVPADVARILRCPGTLNHKQTPPLNVLLMIRGDVTPPEFFLKKFPAPVDLAAARAFGSDELTRTLAQGDFPPCSFTRLARLSLKNKGCQQIAIALRDAVSLEEPLWRAALSIAWRCTDAATAIHKLSNAHPEYSPEFTERKAALTRGPMTCEWYKLNNPDGCNGCSHKVTSPILLARTMDEAEVTDGQYTMRHVVNPEGGETGSNQIVEVKVPAYPFPYFRGSSGGVFKHMRDKDGDPAEPEEIYALDLYIDGRYYDIDDGGAGIGEMVRINLHTPNDGIRKFTCPVTHVLAIDKLREVLSKHGVIVYGKHWEKIMAYLASAIRNLQKTHAADRTRNQMGWTGPDCKSFVIGELEYTENEVRLAPAGAAIKQLAPSMYAKGTLEEWCKIAKFYDRKGMEAHQLAILLGFASPMLRMLGSIDVQGAMINLVSNKSGTGKTTVQKFVNSIFGHPINLLLQKSDTLNSRMQWMGMLNSITTTQDEITNTPPEDVSQMVYDIPNGRGRHRMESQTNQLRVNNTTWCSFSISSSNSSMYDKLVGLKSTPDGELRRLIEIRILRPLDITKQESDEILAKMMENFGTAGPMWVKYLMANRQKVLDLMHACIARVDKDMGYDQSDRYHSTAFGLAMAAGTLLNEMGILSFNLGVLYRYSLSMMGAIKKEVILPVGDIRVVAQETISHYINENIGNTLVINSTKDAMGNMPAPITSPRVLRLRYEPDTQRLWIPYAALRDALTARQVDFRQAMHELVQAGMVLDGGEAVSKRLGTGALGSYQSSSTRCLALDGAGVGVDTMMFLPDPTGADGDNANVATG